MKLSIIVPTLDGQVPESVKRAVEGRAEVELVVVSGVSPVAEARNEGLRRAKGEYVAWADGDDEVSADWLEEILNHTCDDVDMVTFDVRQEWHDGSGRPSAVLDGRHCGQLWSKVFRRSLFEGLTFHGAVHEDFRMLCQLPKDLRRVHIDKVLYVYRRRKDGLSQHRDAWATWKALWGLVKVCDSREMARGIFERFWDFAKTPVRRLIRR